ncbi:MAG: hypothetical protein IJ088_02090 [Clostridia bacterium]|nr:hypothetical protein [Clostridia bacterium]
MKKFFSLVLSLMMVLSCVPAFADTVYTRVAVDSDVTREVLTAFGVPEEQFAIVDSVLSVVNALGVNVIPVADGVQIDLDLNSQVALSLGVIINESGACMASSLFPNYLITVTQETLGQMAKQLMANIPGIGSGDGSKGGADMTAMMELFGSHLTPWIETCVAAGHPGEPVPGEYLFEGYTFDTMVPVTVDLAAITEATQKLLDDLLADPAAMTAIQGMTQNMSHGSGETKDFEVKFKAAFEDWMAHFPANPSAEVYTNSDGRETFYLSAEAIRKDETEHFVANMLYVDSTHMSMGYQDGQATAAGFTMDDTNMRMYFNMGEMYFGLALSFPKNQIAADVYFMNAEKPLISVMVSMSEGGERTLSMSDDSRTVVSVETAMTDETGEAIQGLMGDIMTNGLGTLMGVLSEQVPEAASFMSMFAGE